jgi:hypothetical protein
MRKSQSVQFYGTNTMQRFEQSVYLEDKGVRMMLYGGMFGHSNRTVLVYFLLAGDANRAAQAQTFFTTIKPAGSQ